MAEDSDVINKGGATLINRQGERSGVSSYFHPAVGDNDNLSDTVVPVFFTVRDRKKHIVNHVKTIKCS